MELQAGKKYHTAYGIGRAVEEDYRTMKMFFDNVEGDDGRPVYYRKGECGRSNVSFLTTQFDLIEEVTEQE